MGMTPEEIRDTYAELRAHDAFQVFESHGVDSDAVAKVLGDDVAKDYENWVYYNLK